MEQKSSKKKQVLSIFLVLVILLGACSVSVTFYVKNYITEGVEAPVSEPIPSKTPAPDKNTFTAYLSDNLIANTHDSSKVKTNLSTNISVDTDSVRVEGGKANADVIKYTLKSLSGKIGEAYPSHEGEFGDNFDTFPSCSLNAKDISEFEFRQGEVDPENEEETAKEVNYSYFTVKTNEFEIIDSPAVSQHGFPYYSSADLKPAIKKVTDSLFEMLDVTDCEIKANASTIEGKAERLTDQLEYLKLSADYNITLDISFKGDYAALGNSKISFNLTVKEEYSYTWAGVNIADDTIHLNHNEENTLPLEVDLSDKATEKDYKIRFESENSDIVSVDKDGNIKGLEISESPVKVTVIFEYLGNTYTDSCDVYVTVPVKHIKTTPDKLTLNVGESKKLDCKISPDDATIKKLEWHSEDESIAVISDDGTVTAVGKGKVKVYAVSLDGYLRSSCAVTVKEVK
ncbi:MAG: Ig-like domain-containing protein [Clostridia bacterium]|nr:Ig-like domain-containing protein [Clostridia bacterium]